MEAGVQVVKERDGGIVRRVVLLDQAGGEVELVTRFLSHLSDPVTAGTPCVPMECNADARLAPGARFRGW